MPTRPVQIELCLRAGLFEIESIYTINVRYQSGFLVDDDDDEDENEINFRRNKTTTTKIWVFVKMATNDICQNYKRRDKNDDENVSDENDDEIFLEFNLIYFYSVLTIAQFLRTLVRSVVSAISSLSEP